MSIVAARQDRAGAVRAAICCRNETPQLAETKLTRFGQRPAFHYGVNALGATSESQAGLLATMILQGSPAPAVQTNAEPSFLNIINVVMDGSVPPPTVVPPLRSLLGANVGRPDVGRPDVGRPFLAAAAFQGGAAPLGDDVPGGLDAGQKPGGGLERPPHFGPERRKQIQEIPGAIASVPPSPEIALPPQPPSPPAPARSLTPQITQAPPVKPASAPAAPIAFTARIEPKSADGQPAAIPQVAPASSFNDDPAQDDSQQPDRQPARQTLAPHASPQVSAASPVLAGPVVAAPVIANTGPSLTPITPTMARPIETPYQATAAAIRTAEPVTAPAPLAPHTHAAQEIAVRISQPQAAPVDLHIAERAGEVHVAVRTADASLQVSLREDLGSLVHSLDRAGFRAETFTPSIAAVHGVAESSSTNSNFRGSQSDSQPGAFAQPDRSGTRQQQQQQHQRQRGALAWFNEMEKAA